MIPRPRRYIKRVTNVKLIPFYVSHLDTHFENVPLQTLHFMK